MPLALAVVLAVIAVTAVFVAAGMLIDKNTKRREREEGR